MSFEYKDNTLREQAWKQCKEFLGEPWKSVSLEDFKLFDVRGGFSNSLYRCSAPVSAIKDQGAPSEVLLRMYGNMQDSPDVVLVESVTFMLLSERGLGPKLYGVFTKGRIEEYIHSRSLSCDDLRLYYTSVAREMAKIHTLEVPIRKTPDFIPVSMEKWFKEVEEILLNDKENNYMSCDEYRKEIDWLLKELEKYVSPVVFCHNDLHGGNVLLKEGSTQNGKSNLMLIDFELASYNYSTFDLANHLSEWCFNYDTKDYPHFQVDVSKFPSREEQREFLTVYFDQLTKEGIHLKNPLTEEVEKTIKAIPIFICAAHLMWSLWSIKSLLTSNAGFALKINLRSTTSEEIQNPENGTSNKEELAKAPENGTVTAIQEFVKVRRKLYHKFKEQYLSSLSSTNM